MALLPKPSRLDFPKVLIRELEPVIVTPFLIAVYCTTYGTFTRGLATWAS